METAAANPAVPTEMDAVVLKNAGGPDGLELRRLPIPIPATGQVLVKVAACGVCGHDVLSRQGHLRHAPEVVLGHEIAGTVAAVGPGSARFSAGDRVASRQRSCCHRCRFCRSGREMLCRQGAEYGQDLPGGYAEYVVVDELGLAPVPPGVDLGEAAIAACAVGTCLRALRSADVGVGMRVAVTGAGGGLGGHALQIARAMGATTVAVTSSATKIDALKDCADEVALLQDGRYDAELRSRGLEPDVVLDLTAKYTLGESLRVVKRGGTVAIVGNAGPGAVEIVPGALIAREIRLIGVNGTTREELEDSLDLIARGVVRPRIDCRLPLAEASRAHGLMERRRANGRVLLVP